MSKSKKVSPPPGFIKDLWENDPNKAHRACRKGGRRKTVQQKKKTVPAETEDMGFWTTSYAQRVAEAAAMAEERHDTGETYFPDL